MRQYRFRALVTLGPAASGGPARRLPGRTHALTAHACCLIQPFRHRDYFPAVISRDEETPMPPAGRAVMTIALADGEAEAFFAPGQCFTIGPTVRSAIRSGPMAWSATESPPVGCHRLQHISMTAGFARRSPARAADTACRPARCSPVRNQCLAV